MGLPVDVARVEACEPMPPREFDEECTSARRGIEPDAFTRKTIEHLRNDRGRRVEDPGRLAAVYRWRGADRTAVSVRREERVPREVRREFRSMIKRAWNPGEDYL